MKNILLLATLLLFSIVNADEIPPGTVNYNEISIRGIYVFSKRTEILDSLVPISSIETSEWESSGLVTVIESNGLVLAINDEWGILSLSCESSCNTSFGLSIGDDYEKVISQFGKPSQEREGYASYWFCNKHSCIDSKLGFYFRDNKIYKIDYWVAYV